MTAGRSASPVDGAPRQAAVLLTGATGYVGRAVLERLTAAGVRVRCLVLPGDPATPPSGPLVEAVNGDLTSLQPLDGLVDGVQTIVHSAAVMPPARPELFQHVNVEGTRRLLTAASESGARRFVYLSAVSAAYRVHNAYGASKLAAEALVRESRLPHTILRPTMVYGPGGGLHFQKLVSLVRSAPGVLPVIGPGTQRLAPVLIDDVVAAVELARTHADAAGRTYAVAGATVVSFDELVDRIGAAIDRRPRKLHLPLSLCRGLARLSERVNPESFLNTDAVTGVTQDAAPDWSQFARDCGYSPVTLDDGLIRALRP